MNALAKSQRDYEGTTQQVDRVLTAYLSRCLSPERDTRAETVADVDRGFRPCSPLRGRRLMLIRQVFRREFGPARAQEPQEGKDG